LAILATLAVDTTEDTLAGVGEPTGAELAQARVDGYHVTYFGGAVFIC
jgi:hypothetical protein